MGQESGASLQGLASKQNRFYDNTMLGSYKECPRRFFLRHVLAWRSEGTSLPLIFGLSWHSAMDVVWEYASKLSQADLPRAALAKFYETWEGEGMPPELSVEQIEQYTPRTPNIAHEMLVQYVQQRWGMLQDAQVIAVEQPFAVPLPLYPDVWYIGKMDKVVRYNGNTLALEHKTTTEYKKDGGFKSSYIEGWYSDSQIKGYQFGGGLFYDDLTQVWVDAALVHKTVHDKYRFVPVAHQFPLLEEWVNDTREWVKRVEKDLNQFKIDGQLRPGVFPKNENSCFGKYGACPFVDICRTTSDPSKLDSVPAGYMVEKWEPFEILGLDKLIKQGETSEPKEANNGNTGS